MSVFWKYFRKTLRWPLIWSDGYLALLVKGGALVLDQAREDILEIRRQAMPESCDLQYLDRIAQGRGVARWENELDDFWRTRVVNAFKFNQEGGRKSCIEQLFSLAGIDAQIIEAHEIFDLVRDAGGVKVDGSWALDGSVVLQDFYNLHGLPYVSWAEFIVKVDLASSPLWGDLGQKIVNEFKPARSRMIYFYGLDIELPVAVEIEFNTKLTKEITATYSKCTPRLDGTWNLGVDGYYYALDGRSLDGSWRVGAMVPDAANTRLHQCNIFVETTLEKEIERPAAYITPRLGESCLTVCGGWVLGINKVITLGDIKIFKDRKINGRWTVSADNGVKLCARQLM
jgi:hypothetical protein